MKDVVLTDRGPKPIGPYSQAIKSNGFVFVSGQIALDAKTGEFAAADIRLQTEKVFENLKGILEASGASLSHVVKATVYLKEMNDFAAMNEVYARFFPVAAPARTTIQVARLPKDALVEIDVIAFLRT
jgi:2-iminobutanoate/2-iminopropanoate deaminase